MDEKTIILMQTIRRGMEDIAAIYSQLESLPWKKMLTKTR